MKRKQTAQAAWHRFLYGQDNWTWDELITDPKGWNSHSDKLYREYWFLSRGLINKRRYKHK